MKNALEHVLLDIKTLLAHNREVLAEQIIGEIIYKSFSLFCELVIDKKIIRAISQELHIIGFSVVRNNNTEMMLVEQMKQVDKELGEDLGGFYNLMSNIMDTYSVRKNPISFSEIISPEEKAILEIFVRANEQVEALLEISEAFGVHFTHVPSSIFLWAVAQLLKRGTENGPQEGLKLVQNWLQQRLNQRSLGELFSLAPYLHHIERLTLKSKFRSINEVSLALWFLSYRVSLKTMLSKDEQFHLELLLKRANLGSLSVFKQAGFFSAEAEITPISRGC